MNTELCNELAQMVDTAAYQRQPIQQLSKQGFKLTLAEAYQVQAASVAMRLERGEQVIGIKMGFTSRAKMLQMGVDDLIWGPLTDAMMIPEGGEIDLSRFIHPRIEPEIAFRLKKSISGQISLLEAQAAVDAVAPALEIIDSRYCDFSFSLEDVVADNCSSSGVILGSWHSNERSLSNIGMVMEIDGKAVQIGSSAAILGNPWRSLVAAARLAGESGQTLAAGSIVLAGAATAAEPLHPGQYIHLITESLGSVSLTTSASEMGGDDEK
ncbi:2-keto-4-pentenoate hydratase [Shewanella sp. NIFS-20-20]|uniref:2-keto-4-pentenoate hydratase n=1 Tax=Shewanella sp. NIFS-20-20 TaxID=2853806 RepID=UPI001C491EA6|nr:fumarylacetoacetate hydrolase family protein [Shewanella sp. NIFS-20-20]MBV7315106.1 fumarylacetoacetate hydrolase family protein [Shewanella sp. NIFS-20-20]